MSASGKIIAPSVPTDKAEHLKQLMLKAHIPALSIAFISDNKITSADTLSLSNQQTNTDDVFWACSLSKPVFSYLVFKLWQAGELDKKNENGEIIEKFDPAATPLWTIFNDPRFNNDERRKALTADIILSHQSGLPNEAKAGIGSGDLEFEFKPGEKFKYSGEGLYYLQKVIEKIMAPKKLHNLAREFLFNPLGVSSKTTFKLTKDDSPVKNHDETGSPKTDFLRYHENNNNNAAGSLHTTAMDYALILTGILNDTDFINFITPRVDMQNDMEAKQQGVDAKTLRPISWSHGLGLQRSETNSDKASFAFHWGDGPGAKGFFVVDLNSKSGFVYFGNGENALSMMQEAAKLAELPACQPIIEFLSQKYHHPDIKTPGFDEKIQAQISETEGRFSEAIALYKKVLASKSNFNAETINKKINWLEPLTKKFEPSTSQLEKYCGEYGPLKVTKSGNALQFETPGGRYDLIPMGENWFAPKNDLTFRLEFDNNNQLKSHFYDGRIFSDKKLPAPREELHMGASYRSSTAFLMMRHNLTPTASIPAPDYPLGAQNNQSTTHAISSPGNSSTSATIEITNQQAEDQQKTAPSVKSPFKNLSETPKLTRE